VSPLFDGDSCALSEHLIAGIKQDTKMTSSKIALCRFAAITLLAAVFVHPAWAGEARAGAASSVVVKVVPAGSPQEGDVLAALNDALHEGSPPRTLDEVNQWSAKLTTALHQGGFAVGQVLMTQEDWDASVKTGQSVFTVFPGRISEIEVKNASRMDQSRVEKMIAKALCGQAPDDLNTAGCFFETKRFERATQLLQDLPGVALGGAPQFGPGKGVGDVKTTFSIAEKGKPFSVGASVDNGGVQTTGRTRGTLSISANNYFGLGEDYAASITRSTKGMWTGSLSGGIPILSDGLRLTGGFTRQQYTVSQDGLTFSGTSNTGMLGLSYPFTRGLDANLWGNLSYLHSKSRVDYRDFGFSTGATLDALKATLSANNGDRAQQMRTDQWAGQVALTYGRQKNDDPLDKYGPDRAGNYGKLSASGFASWALNQSGDFFVTARGTGQYANKNLDGSEQLGVGGPYAVRGYRADEPMLNDGVLLGTGLYKRFSIAEGHQMQIGPIIDYAYGIVNHNTWTGWESSYPGINVGNSRQLASYGLEAAWLTPIGATLTLSASKPFGDKSWIKPKDDGMQYWFTVSWSSWNPWGR
jgi:hemolysin activation/secretion protein